MSNIPTTQEHLPIAGIQDGAIIMNDATIRVVLKVEPINFELKSEQEQNAIIYAYQGFLNSLEFPIQFVIQSKKLDLTPYLNRIEQMGRQNQSELLRIQTQEYVDFVRQLITVANIMGKKFYCIIAYGAGKIPSPTSILNLFGKKSNGPVLDQANFDQMKGEAYNQASLIAGGLARLGARARALNTQELIELFYQVYNPDVAGEARLTNLSIMNSGIITSPDATAIGTISSITEALKEVKAAVNGTPQSPPSVTISAPPTSDQAISKPEPPQV